MIHEYVPGNLPDPVRKKGKKYVCQNIYTFDIEVTTVFKHPDGWGVFRDNENNLYYKNVEKGTIPYIWMLGIEQPDGSIKSVFGRYFGNALKQVFEELSDKKHKKIVWIHNLPYEFQNCLIDILPMPLDKMVCRKARKPVRFYVPAWNIEFRCSFALTGLSLSKSAEAYGKHRKRNGNKFNYNKLRTPLTHLNKHEFKYCEMDVVSLAEVIQHYRREYGKLSRIPLTATGEIRRELRNLVDMEYIKNVRRLTPKNPKMFVLLMRAFQGGYTHSCYLRTGKTLYNVLSIDKASAYPADMASYKFPMGPFFQLKPDIAQTLNNDTWCTLWHVRFYGIESRIINHYILTSKCVQVENIRNDNGRLISADMIEMVLTNVDFDIIQRCYEIDKMEVIDVYASRAGYLPKPLIEYMLTLYEQKTTLKNMKEHVELYRKSKTRINGLFGCCVTNIIKGSAEFSNDDPEQPGIGPHWWTHSLTDDFICEELDKLRKSRTNCFAYQWGVWITAYCRMTTWAVLEALDVSKVGIDKAAIYSDTDSVKAPDSEELRAIINSLNNDRMDRLKKMCQCLDINPERLAPHDPAGISHPLGMWEPDGRYVEFKTLGAKRYAYIVNGKLSATISGVNSKTGYKQLSGSLYNFRKDIIFSYANCGKNIAYYIDDGKPFDVVDVEGNLWHETGKHGMALYPTTYSMGIDPVYEALFEDALTYGGIKNER